MGFANLDPRPRDPLEDSAAASGCSSVEIDFTGRAGRLSCVRDSIYGLVASISGLLAGPRGLKGMRDNSRRARTNACTTVEERRSQRRVDYAMRCGLPAPVVVFARAHRRRPPGLKAPINIRSQTRPGKGRSSTAVHEFMVSHALPQPYFSMHYCFAVRAFGSVSEPSAQDGDRRFRYLIKRVDTAVYC
jgi:hypothetical protein